MKLSVIKQALDMYLAIGDWSDEELQEINEAIQETANIERIIEPNKDIWRNEVRIVSVESSCDIGNALLYDIYGLQARLTGGVVSLKEFIAGARKEFGCEYLSDEFLQDAYDIVSDLWCENEADGYHNADGTFKRQ